MTEPRRLLGWLVASIAAAMAAAAAYSLAAPLPPEELNALAGFEVVAMAVLVLPWFAVFARRAAVCFTSEQAAARAWGVLAAASVLLLAGQIGAYLPAAVDLGGAETVLVILGQLLPAAFRVALCWALWRMRNAYRATGLDFHLTGLEYGLSAAVALVALFLVSRTDVLFDYWTTGSDLSQLAVSFATGLQVFNFLLYAAVFFVSISITRYAVQMGGGLVARAWGGVALYGLLQPLHAFIIALFWPVYGPILAVAFDNFIVLCAFAALAFGAIYQVEAADVSRPPAELRRE